MKEKIKQTILYFMIFYTITITFMLIINISTSTKYIELSDSEDNLTKLNNLKQELTKLEHNSCTDLINELITYYEETSYNGPTSLRTIAAQPMINHYIYLDLQEQCQLTKDESEKYHLTDSITSITINHKEILTKYTYQHELKIMDSSSDQHLITNYLTEVEYHLMKKTELYIISSLIELINERNESYAQH